MGFGVVVSSILVRPFESYMPLCVHYSCDCACVYVFVESDTVDVTDTFDRCTNIRNTLRVRRENVNVRVCLFALSNGRT